MASSSKTNILGLNQWVGTDTPKRADFNNDNSILEIILGAHYTDSSIHVTSTDKAKWNELYKIGYYYGSGTASQTITLTFSPSAVFVAQNGRPFNFYNATDAKTYIHSGFAINSYRSSGITLETFGFKVEYSTATPSYSNAYPSLNSAGSVYMYIAFR